MITPKYLSRMKITPEILKSAHIQPVGEYFNRKDDVEHLIELMEGENQLLIHGNLELAVTKLQSVYDSIPASETILREHVKLVLLEAKNCQRY